MVYLTWRVFVCPMHGPRFLPKYRKKKKKKTVVGLVLCIKMLISVP